MNLNSLITGPARFGLSLAGRALSAVRGRLGGEGIDDETLQESVEEQVFASRKVARSKVEVSVTEGVVWLRGEVRSVSAIREAEEAAAGVPGVDRVENLLRVAKAPAKPKGQKRPAPKRSARPAPAAATAEPPTAQPVAEPAPRPEPAASEPASPEPARPEPPAPEPATPTPPPLADRPEHTVTRRFNAERTPDEAEPSPRELAERGQGRQPAPLGAEETVGATGAPGTGDSPSAPFPSTGNGDSAG